MHTPSRLILTAAVAGAAVLVPLTAAAPAFADSHPATTATLTLTPSASTVVTGDAASVSVKLEEDAGGDPGGLSGRIVIDKTQNGVTTTRVDAVTSAFTVESRPIDTTGTGPITIHVTFVASPSWETNAQATTYITVLGKSKVNTDATTVKAGDSIIAFVGELNGSDAADGKIEATAPGLTLPSCGPTPDNPEQSTCAIPVPKNTPSGTYPVTLTFTASPRYADSTVTTPIQIIGTAASTTSSPGTTPAASKGATSTASTSRRTSSGTTGNADTGSGALSGTGSAALGGSAVGTAGSTATVASADGTSSSTAVDSTPAQIGADASSGQPTAVSAPLPGTLDAGVPAAVVSSVGLSFLPILIGGGVLALIFLLLIVLAIVLLVRSARRRTA